MVRKQLSVLFTFVLALTLVVMLLLLVQAGVSQAAPVGQAAPVEQADGQVYIVQAGDSLYKIGNQLYGEPSRWQAIVEGTNAKAAQDKSFSVITNPSVLRVGQKLWVPSLTAAQQPTSTANLTATATETVEEAAAPTRVPINLPRVFFKTPTNGATVPLSFTVEMSATGLTVEPSGEIHAGAGHMHVLVDTDFVPAGDVIINDESHKHFGKGQLTTSITLTPGIHVLRLQFANGAHVALDGPQYQDTITVTVSPTATHQSVRFVEPTNNAVVPPVFEVKTAATGLTVERAGEIHPNAGHMHVLVDTDFVPAGDVIIRDDQHIHLWQGQLTTPITLTPGIHVLRLQFSNSAHVALDGPQYQDTITVTVSPTATHQSVRFVEPTNNAVVPPVFEVKTAATGLTVERAGEIHPNAGHMHVLVDTDFVPAGDVIIRDDQHIHLWQGQLTTPITLTPGIHVLRLQFSNSAHVALDGPQYQDTITVTVSPTATHQSVRFVEPTNNAVVPPVFEVKTAATGLTVERAGEIHPNAGHMHVLVDTDFVPAGDVIIRDDQHIHLWQGQLTTPITLTPGIHVLRLQFSNSAHVALDGPQYQDTITVTVSPTATGQSVRFVEPANNAVVPPVFEVKTAATGLTVERAGEIHPNAGHMHVLVDTDFVPAGDVIIRDDQHIHLWQGQLTTPITLTPGIHVLRLQFSNSAHVALDGPQYQDTITVTVAETSTGQGVHFISPTNGATVSPKFDVQMGATGLTVEPAGHIHPDAGHMHILVDTDFVPAGDVVINDEQHKHFGQGQLTTTLELAPGEHILRLQFANGAHIALDGPQYRDTISVTVK